jgi:hypothetical protein
MAFSYNGQYFRVFEALFRLGRELGGELSEIKTREILLVLKQIDRPLFESLFHFAAPEKKRSGRFHE